MKKELIPILIIGIIAILIYSIKMTYVYKTGSEERGVPLYKVISYKIQGL